MNSTPRPRIDLDDREHLLGHIHVVVGEPVHGPPAPWAAAAPMAWGVNSD